MDDIVSVIENLDSRLILAKFGELVDHQRNLYRDYNEIDEADEINRDWKEFSKTVVDHLINIQNLTESLYNRVTDEIKRQAGTTSQEDLERLQDITSFWLDTSVMSYLYTTIQKSGVLKQEGMGKKPMGYYYTQKSFDKINLLAYMETPFFNQASLKTILSIINLNQQKKELLLLDEINEHPEIKTELLELYNRGQAEFLLNDVRTRIAEGAVLWWWKDPIAMHSAVEHGIFHLNSMKKQWEEINTAMTKESSEYYEMTFSKVQLRSNVYLSQHYRKIAEEAMKVGALGVASEYFQEAKEIILKQGEPSLVSEDFIDGWSTQTIQEQYLTYGLVQSLCKVSLSIQKILNYMKDDKLDLIKVAIQEALEQTKEILKKGDQPYLSSVALMYDTILTYMRDQLKSSTKKILKHTLDFVHDRLDMGAKRLESATNSIYTRWNHAFVNYGKDTSLLRNILKDVDHLKFAILTLDVDEDRKHKLHTQLESMKLATEAHSLVFYADQLFGKNPVKELLIRAKAIHLAFNASTCCNVQQHENYLDEIKTFLNPIMQYSLIRGLIAEVQLRTALLQFTFINTIANILENSNLVKGKKVLASSSRNLEELETFKESGMNIRIAADTLIKVKAPVKINNQDINYGYFVTLSKSMGALSNIIELLKLSMQAYQPKGTLSSSKTVSIMDSASKKAYEAASILGKSEDEKISKLAEQIYMVGQMFNQVVTSLRDGKDLPEDYPLMPILDIIQNLIM